ncbi:MAG: hypothetical protein Q7J44_14010 [Pseudotabrizicola sp.]|uniref:hypothetical protein n=1 Tax=Pseudotabrizicola sp. TaxID=2939647 RepID=UPI002718E514|nr:hypothetical protein [Pseudotabrizicola sp.]MDO9639650.1 hypothetical protein [Pseudotabrizicola sp.]
MIAPSLVPKVGVDDLTPEAWIAEVVELSGRIRQLRETPCDISSVAIFGRAHVVEFLSEDLVALMGHPKAQPWLAEIQAGVGVMFGRAS